MADKKNKDFIKIAAIQNSPVFLNKNESVKKASALIEEAAQKNAEVIALPETWLPGYPVWLDFAPEAGVWNHPGAKSLFRTLYKNSIEIGDESFNALLNKAKETNSYIIIGAHERVKGTLYNTLFIFNKNGKDFITHRKLVPTYTERLVWGRGDGSTILAMDTEFGTLGGLICWEHWMPLLRATMHSKNEVLHIAQWPTAHDLHQLCSRQYAFEGQCFVIASGTYLTKGEVIEGYKSTNNPEKPAIDLLESMPCGMNDPVLNGGTAIIGPDSTYIVEPIFGKSEIIHAEIDLDKTVEGKLTMDSDGHYSRPDIFTLEVNTAQQSNIKETE